MGNFKLTDMLLWQQLRDELWRTNQSKIKQISQQSNPAELATYEERAPGVDKNVSLAIEVFFCWMQEWT